VVNNILDLPVMPALDIGSLEEVLSDQSD